MPRRDILGFFFGETGKCAINGQKTQKVSIIGDFLIKWRESFVYGKLKF
jgi:hypothetical protein